MVRCETEFVASRPAPAPTRRNSVTPMIAPSRPDVALPSERRGGLDAHPRADARRKNRIAVRLRLLLEQFPTGH